MTAEVYGGALAGMGLTIGLVIGTFLFVCVAGIPAWLAAHPRKPPSDKVHYVGKPDRRGRHRRER